MKKEEEDLMRDEIFDYYVRKLALGETEVIIDGFKCGIDINKRTISLIEYTKTRKSAPLIVPNIFEEVNSNAFTYMYKLSGIKFGDRLERINSDAFNSLKNIDYIDLRNCNNLVYIGKRAFSYIEVSIELNLDKALIIDSYAFANRYRSILSINGSSIIFKDLDLAKYQKLIYNGHIVYINQVKLVNDKLMNIEKDWYTIDCNAWKNKIVL